MYKYALSITFVLFAILIMPSCDRPSRAPPEASEILASQSPCRIDLGVIRDWSNRELSLAILNDSADDWHAPTIRKSCGCITANLADTRDVQRGEYVHLHVIFRPSEVFGTFVRALTIKSANGTSLVSIEFRGTIDIDIQPLTYDFNISLRSQDERFSSTEAFFFPATRTVTPKLICDPNADINIATTTSDGAPDGLGRFRRFDVTITGLMQSDVATLNARIDFEMKDTKGAITMISSDIRVRRHNNSVLPRRVLVDSTSGKIDAAVRDPAMREFIALDETPELLKDAE